MAQPDPGLVLPGRRGRAADHERGRPADAARPAADAHLRRRPVPEHHATACSAPTPTRSSRSTWSTRWSATAASSPTACAAASGTGSSARSSSTSRSSTRTRRSTTTYAAAGADPVTLFINDYNTEQGGKQARYKALVERLLARGVPVDGVGHQFHVTLAMPVSALDDGARRVRGPAGDAGRHRARRHHRHAGDPGEADRAGLLLPRRVPGLPGARRRPVRRHRLGSHRRPELAQRAGAPLVFDDAPAGQARLLRRGRRRAAGPAADGERLRRRRAADADATSDVRVAQLPLHSVEDAAALPAALGARPPDGVRHGRRRRPRRPTTRSSSPTRARRSRSAATAPATSTAWSPSATAATTSSSTCR